MSDDKRDTQDFESGFRAQHMRSYDDDHAPLPVGGSHQQDSGDGSDDPLVPLDFLNNFEVLNANSGATDAAVDADSAASSNTAVSKATESSQEAENAYRGLDFDPEQSQFFSAQNAYSAGADQPYESAFGHVDKGSGFVAEGGLGTHHNNNPYASKPKKKKKPVWLYVLIVCVVLAGVGAGGYMFWQHRPVEVHVNGSRRTISINTTIAQLKSQEGIKDEPGNLVSVSGKVLEEGKGNPYSVSVDGQKKSFDDGSAYRVHGGESITIDKGDDTMEPYDSEIVETQPKLEMQGSEGAIAYISQWGKVDKRERRTGKISGETADGTVEQQGQNCVVTVKTPVPKDGKKLVALTFDDGPSSYTPQYLQILKEHGAVATFFNLGEAVEANPEISRQIVESGNELASHTYSHKQLIAVPADVVYDELTKTFKLLKDKVGVTTTMFRPPYGDFHLSTWLESKGTVSSSINWNMDSEDWRRPGADKIVSNSITGIAPGYIILMHDGGGPREQDLEALPTIIDTLHNQGYTFVTVSELMKSDESIPADVAAGNATMPADAVWPTEIAK